MNGFKAPRWKWEWRIERHTLEWSLIGRVKFGLFDTPSLDEIACLRPVRLARYQSRYRKLGMSRNRKSHQSCRYKFSFKFAFLILKVVELLESLIRSFCSKLIKMLLFNCDYMIDETNFLCGRTISIWQASTLQRDIVDLATQDEGLHQPGYTGN